MQDFRNPKGDAQVFPYGDGSWLRVEDLKTPDGNTVRPAHRWSTALKQAELALDRQSAQILHPAAEYSPTSYAVSPRTSHIPSSTSDTPSSSAARTTNWLGDPCWTLFAEKDFASASGAHLSNLLAESPLWRASNIGRWPTAATSSICGRTRRSSRGNNLVEYISVGRDVTQLKLQQRRMAKQSAELQRKNDALNQFTGTVSHDLKAPLRHMSMFSEMIGEDVAQPGNLDELPVYAEPSAPKCAADGPADRQPSGLRADCRRDRHMADSVSMTDVISDAILNFLDSLVAGSRGQHRRLGAAAA